MTSSVVTSGLTIDLARDVIKEDWSRSGYYDEAEKQLEVFWSDTYPFYPLFRRLVLDDVIELACGHGRHSAQVLAEGRRFTLVDVNQKNVDFCKARFKHNNTVEALLGDGSSLSQLPSGRYTAVFCYDAMVHFELEDVIAYLREIFRVLMSGGQALLHFSNYDRNPGGSYHDNPHWRNFNSIPITRHLTVRTGFDILHMQALSWGHDADLDGVVLLRKP